MSNLGSLVQGVFGGPSYDPSTMNQQMYDATVSPASQSLLEEERRRREQQQAQAPLTVSAPSALPESIRLKAPTAEAAQLQQVGQSPQTIAAQQQQKALGQSLMQQAAGQGGPTAAQSMFQSNKDAAIRAAAAQAAGTMGLSPAQQARIASDAGAQATLQAASQSAQLRAQEQQAAQGLASQVLGQQAAQGLDMRGQDIQQATTQAQLQQQINMQNAEMQQQAAMQQAQMQQAAQQFNISTEQAAQLANIQAQLQQREMTNEERMQILQTQLGIDASRASAINQAINNSLTAQQTYNQQIASNAQSLGALTGAAGNFVGGVAGGIGSIIGMFASDKNLKKNVAKADDDIDAFLSKMSPKAFDYIDEKFGHGRRYGIMAQDAEKTPAGKFMVEETADGKAINAMNAIGLLLAGQARLNKRLKKVEGK